MSEALRLYMLSMMWLELMVLVVICGFFDILVKEFKSVLGRPAGPQGKKKGVISKLN